MSLSIDKLQQLVAVARTGSFSKAAVELNISQPALSRSIASIETHYGFRIFNRLGHGVELTAAGAPVIAQAQPLLQSMRVFDNNLRLFGAGDAGQLFIGLAPLLASQLLSRFAAEFFAAHTMAQLRVTIRPGLVLLEELQHDRIEMFFYPEGHIDPKSGNRNSASRQHHSGLRRSQRPSIGGTSEFEACGLDGVSMGRLCRPSAR